MEHPTRHSIATPPWAEENKMTFTNQARYKILLNQCYVEVEARIENGLMNLFWS